MLTPSFAVADPAEDDLNRQGVEARKRDDDAAALELFRKAYQLHQSPRAAAQMGLAEIALGRWSDAEKHLEEAIKATADPWIQKNDAVLRETLTRVRNQFGNLQVLGSPEGAEVVVEGKVVATMPMSKAARVRTGECRFEVRAPGYASATRTVTIETGIPKRETVDLSPIPAVATTPSVTSPPRAGNSGTGTAKLEPEREPSSPDPSLEPAVSSSDSAGISRDPPNPSSRSSVRTIVALGAAGLALVTLTLGIVEHISWQSKVNSFENTAGCDSAVERRGVAGCSQFYDEGQRAKTFMFVGYGLSVGLAVTAAIIHFMAPASAPEPQKVACRANLLTLGLDCAMRF